MDEIVRKLAGLSLPGVILVIITVISGGNSAAVAAALTAVAGLFGIVGEIALLGIIIVVEDAIAESGIEAILKAVYTERSKSKSIRFFLKEIYRYTHYRGAITQTEQ